MKYTYTLLCLLIGLQAFSQNSSLLWKLEGKNLKKSSYLFGTIHLIPAKDYFVPKGLDEAFNKSELLVGEMDLSDLSSMTMEMMSNLSMKGDTTLDMLLTKEEYTKLNDKFMSSLGIGLDFMKSFKPFIISTMIMSSGTQEDNKSYEMELLEKANKKGMTMAGLETLQEQMAFLDVLPYTYQAKELVKMLDQGSENDEFQKMVEIYKSQNLDSIVAMVKEQGEDGQMEDILLKNRNKNWIAKIVKFASDKPTFFAVGAAHLGGKNGIIDLLRAEGYKLTPIIK
jgi:uncharacterized protein YbaP (TraB family)